MTDSRERPRVLELVGLAGTGKTTLEHLLHLRDDRIRLIVAPDKARYVPFAVRRAGLWLSSLLWRYQGSRSFTWDEVRLIGHLEVWAPYLRTQKHVPGSVIVLNPGPVYWLAALSKLSPSAFQNQARGEWRDRMLSQWAALVDLFVWLDAPDDLLLERIRTRDEWHVAKEQTDGQVLERFAHLRKGYGQILAEMARRGGQQVLRFQTDQVSSDQIADQVFAALCSGDR
jgi:hypothetical protein